jgi:NADPH:quinone reductase-like Zn-dependent oxidoreductase
VLADHPNFGGPDAMDIVDLPDPISGNGEQLLTVASSGVDVADTHQRLSANRHLALSRIGARQLAGDARHLALGLRGRRREDGDGGHARPSRFRRTFDTHVAQHSHRRGRTPATFRS